MAEMGDKTQLLALVLAARFMRPWPVVWGILLATVLNHSLAGALGAWLMALLGPQAMRWVLGLSFLAMAVWVLVPDKLDEAAAPVLGRWGVFGVTTWIFFWAEMGDKTQLATVALAAQYQPWWAVVAGTTLGMMLANVPVVFFGQAITRRLPVVWLHRAAALLFALMGGAILSGWL